MLKKSFRVYPFVFLVVTFFVWWKVALATENVLFLSPDSGSYSLGETFVVSLKINGGDLAIGAIESIISYSLEDLEIVNISKNNSIFNLWVIEPSATNPSGLIKFAGGIIRPGYSGQGGTILTITFKAKREATANVFLGNTTILASDAEATNLAVQALGGSYAIVNEAARPAEAPKRISSKPETILAAPEISSATHPDPQVWYNNRAVQLSWKIPKDMLGVVMLVSQQSQDEPKEFYNGQISEKKLENIEDGVWYFHLKIKNKTGWSKTAHFRFQIDSAPPDILSIELFNTSINKAGSTSVQPTVFVDHRDSLSGAAGHCEVKVDNGDWFASNYETGRERPGKSHLFRLPLQKPGRHIVYIKALDKAGNFIISSKEFTVSAKPISADQKLIILLLVISSLALILSVILALFRKSKTKQGNGWRI